MGDALGSLTRIVQCAVLRGEITLVDESTALRSLQGMTVDGDTPTLEHIEPFGLTGRPAVGYEWIVAALGGTSHRVALAAWDRTKRPHLSAPGDVTLYDGHGNRLGLTSTGATLNTSLNATGGYKVGAATGLNGTLRMQVTPPLPAPPVPVTILTVVIKGGIATSIATGAPWVVLLAAAAEWTWTPDP